MHYKDSLRTLIRTVILSAFSCLIVFSCITIDKSLGSEYIPGEQKVIIKSASFRLPVSMKAMDSLQGVSESFMMLGAFRTEEFGVAKFATAGNIAPTSTSLDCGKDPRVVTTYIHIPLADLSSTSLTKSSIILDPSQEGIPQNISVYRLKKFIDTTDVYNNSINSTFYDPIPVNVGTTQYFGGDSLIIHIDNRIGQEIISSTEAERDSLDLFARNIRGLYLECDTPVGTSNAGRLNLFNRGSAFIYVKFNFQPTWAENLDRKDTLIAVALAYDYCVNTSSFESKEMVYDNKDLLYVEGAGGVNPYIDVQALKDTLDNWAAKEGYDPSKIVIAKATINLPFELPENLDLVDYRYPDYLFPTQRRFLNNTSDLIYYYPFEDYNTTGNGLGAMNRSLMCYSSDFSMGVQEIINKDKSELDSSYNIWLYPLMYEEDQYYGTTYYYINNYSYYNGRINGPAAERYPELKIVYTVLE